ncbi:NADH dehydrogenase (ubiquinone) Fe-S protein 6, partial [Tremellales sp. Uapishka_1]
MSLARITRSLPVRALARYASSIPTPPAPYESKQPTSATPENLQQSPNVPTTWSTSQNPKPRAMSGPRFEQTNLDLQPNSLSAMGMVAEDPIRIVNGRKATCDGGLGPLGHPKVYINLVSAAPSGPFRPYAYYSARRINLVSPALIIGKTYVVDTDRDFPQLGPKACGYCGIRFEQAHHH